MVGCASIPPPPASEPVELSTTPFFPQREFHCGPAALATALKASGVDVTPDAIAPSLYIPGRQGTLQIELVAAARTFDRLAVIIDPTEAALIAQLNAGRPVVVLQNLFIDALPRWHYAVVVGYLPMQDAYVLRSAKRERLVTPRSRFLATWARGELWGMVVVPPSSAPSGLSREPWLRAAAALESAGRHAAALAAFDGAVDAWPSEVTGWLGRGNNLHALGDRAGAMAAWSTALTLRPEQPAALYNLVTTLADTGALCAALSKLPAERPDEHTLIAAARRTVQEALSRASRESPRDCPRLAP
ncbi:MAG: PA2778 family cysteine peptidase [Pseudomonadales bacterium]